MHNARWAMQESAMAGTAAKRRQGIYARLSGRHERRNKKPVVRENDASRPDIEASHWSAQPPMTLACRGWIALLWRVPVKSAAASARVRGMSTAQACLVAVSAPRMGVRLNSGTNSMAMTSA